MMWPLLGSMFILEGEGYTAGGRFLKPDLVG